MSVIGTDILPEKSLQTFKIFLQQIRAVRGRVAIGLTLVVLGTVSNLIQPLATGGILSSLENGESLRNDITLLALVFLGAVVFNYIGTYVLLSGAESLVSGFRRRMVRRSLSLTLAEMNSQNPGELMVRITSDASTIRLLAVTFTTQIVSSTISIVGSLIAMLLINSFLLSITVAVAIIPVTALLITVPKVKEWSKRTSNELGILGKDLERMLGMSTTVKVSGAQEEESERIFEQIQTVEDRGRRTGLWRSVSSALSLTTTQICYVVVLATGGILVNQERITVAALVTFLLYATQLSAPVISLTSAASAFQTGSAAMERIAEMDTMESEAPSASLVVEVPIETTDKAPGANPLDETSSNGDTTPVDVVFDNVTFTYPLTDEPALDALSLRLANGRFTAIVGPSGCGKSTVLRLAAGFFPVDAGTVNVGGRPVREWDLTQLRRRLAYVEQEAAVLEGTVRENLTYGLDVEDGPGTDELHEALRFVSLGEDFRDLDKPIGYRGGSLSGGEQQRIALARGLLRQPDMLLLDESTSALDGTTERDVISRLRNLHGVGIVMIAHRLATIVDADEIVLMDNGQVRAIGTHDQLMDGDEMYRAFVSDGSLASEGTDAAGVS